MCLQRVGREGKGQAQKPFSLKEGLQQLGLSNKTIPKESIHQQHSTVVQTSLILGH